MSKFATKAAANMFCQARYEAAKSNERLSSREGAAEEIGIDRTRLARIELGSTIPYQEEVLLMAEQCPYCSGSIKETKETILKVSEEYDAKAVEQLTKMLWGKECICISAIHV